MLRLAGMTWTFIALSALGAFAEGERPVILQLKVTQEQDASAAHAEAEKREAAAANVRELVLASTPRIPIRTDRLEGSINLQGARLDDLVLVERGRNINRNTRILAPRGTPGGYIVEQGLVSAAGSSTKVPDGDTIWTVESSSDFLSPSAPLKLVYDNGNGLIFRREIAIDSNSLFTITQSIENTGASTTALFLFSRAVREGGPPPAYSTTQYEGPIGAIGVSRPITPSYPELQLIEQLDYAQQFGWLGFADAYWAVTVMPNPMQRINARFAYIDGGSTPNYQAAYVETSPLIASPQQTVSAVGYVFAGSRDFSVIDAYERDFHFFRFGFLNY